MEDVLTNKSVDYGRNFGIFGKEKSETPLFSGISEILLLGYPDSNQERQDQNLQCYHYTIPQSFTFCSALLLLSGCKGTIFSETSKTFSDFFLKKLIFFCFLCCNRIKSRIFVAS